MIAALSPHPGTLAGQLLLAALALFGHAALWIALLNRIHGFALPCRLLKSTQALILPLVPAAVAAFFLWTWHLHHEQGPVYAIEETISALATPARHSWWLAGYVALCWGYGAVVLGRWTRVRLAPAVPALLSNHTQHLDVAEQLGHRPVAGLKTRIMCRLPGNDLLRLDVNEKRLVLPQLPPELDGLAIAHLSDLHYTGRLTADFYHFVVDRANELEADLIAVTGDILDKPACLEWLAPTLGRLRAPHGAYFVLGNHDKRMRDVPAIRRTLTEAGLVDLAGRWQALELRGANVLLAGNEHPWFGPRPRAEDCPLPLVGHRAAGFIPAQEPIGTRDAQAEGDPNDDPPTNAATDEPPLLKILLSHSPDQIGWARRHGFDLLLAGHNHGGQIRLPLIGPIVSPSLYGVRYASGLFHEPPTLMHVSRGIAGVPPIRIQCPPELTRLVLVRGSSSGDAA